MSWKLITILLIFFLSACSVTKKSRHLTDSAKNETAYSLVDLKSINLTTNDFNIRKATIELKSEKESQKILATIKFRKPYNYLISLRSRTGIEAERIFLSNDTILINDRINRKLFYGSPEYIKNKYGVSISAIPLLLGDYIFDSDTNNKNEKCINGTVDFIRFLEDRRISGQIDCSNSKIISVLLRGMSGREEIQINYNDFSINQGVIFPRNIRINDGSGNSSLTIDFSDVDINSGDDIKFIPGSGYERILLR